MFKIENNIDYSKIGFIFLIFTFISGGYVNQILSCQLQNFLTHNIFGKHIIGIILLFSLIMMEGGWSFKKEKIKHTNWSNGNIIDSSIYTIILYTIFVLSSKMQLYPSIIFYTIIFTIYFLNTYRMYNLNQELISNKLNIILIRIEQILIILGIIIFVYGIIDYYYYEIDQYTFEFSWINFLIGTPKCNKIF